MARSLDRPVDADGYRTGHPQDRPFGHAGECAKVLNTSTTTVRALVDSGELAGFWRRKGKRYAYYVYEDAVTAFQQAHGSFPEAKSRRSKQTLRSRTGGSAVQGQILAELRAQRADLAAMATDAASQRAQILNLEHVVRRLSASNQHLRDAVEHQATAGDLARAADEARSRAVRSLNAAGREEAEIAAALGVSDFVPED